MKYNNIAFIFPGQGSQKIGMGEDFVKEYGVAKETFEEADDILKINLSSIAFSGSKERLTLTRYCQLALFVHSIAIFRVVKQLFPEITPKVCSGLSLGEYSALTASLHLSFEKTLPIVQERAEAMHQACEDHQGTMAVVLGLDLGVLKEVLAETVIDGVWIANLNSPGQIVVSGTMKGIATASEKFIAAGAKRVLPLNVHGAFHSGLMLSARRRLDHAFEDVLLQKSAIDFVMNVPGDYVEEIEMMRKNLVQQVTEPVLWQKGVEAMNKKGVDLFVEMGSGNTLAGLNKRIGVLAPTWTISTVEQLKILDTLL